MTMDSAESDSTSQVIIVGYGLNGRNLAKVLGRTGIPYRVLEMNPQNINEARAQGVTLFVASCIVAINFVVDLTYAILDPRIRYD